MARALPGEYQRSYSRSSTVVQNQAMNTSASRGIGGGLLLGFSDCVKGGAAGQVYVATQNRLRGVHCTGDSMYWHFEPLEGTQHGTTDVITMSVVDSLQPAIWKTIQSYIGGSQVSDVLAWIHNPCAVNASGTPAALAGVTAITIVVASND